MPLTEDETEPARSRSKGPDPLPPGYRQRYQALTDLDALQDSLDREPRKSLRVNTLASSKEEVVELLQDHCRLEPVPWCPEGYFIENGEVRQSRYGSLPGHSAGLFYIQEASSMAPARVLDPQPGELILDLCAAPGGKTTQMAQYMENKGRIWAVDPKVKRLNMLRTNLQRLGVANVTLKRETGSKLSYKGRPFDRVLVDAPCSGTGTMRSWLWKVRNDPFKEWDDGLPVVRVLRIGLNAVFAFHGRSLCVCPSGDREGEQEEDDRDERVVIREFHRISVTISGRGRRRSGRRRAARRR